MISKPPLLSPIRLLDPVPGRCVEVLVAVEAGRLPQPFTYLAPAALAEDLVVGTCVRVPFGPRELLGFVVATDAAAPAPGIQLRSIIERVDAEPFFDAKGAALIAWLEARTHCSALDALRCVVPEAIAHQIERMVYLVDGKPLDDLSPRQLQIVEWLRAEGGKAGLTALKAARGGDSAGVLVAALRARGIVEVKSELRAPRARPRVRKGWAAASGAEAQLEALGTSSPKQAEALRFALEAGDVPILQADLSQRFGASAVATLARKGLLLPCPITVAREPSHHPRKPVPARDLTPEQRTALAPILSSLARSEDARFLLHGVTASGKTEVYLRAVQACIESGRGALLLVPEISLTAQLLDLVKGWFGPRAAVLHSRLSQGERYDEWCRIRRGEARVVVGARSAVFAPLCDPGLLILDEEHETSYKQESAPRYHTRDVAVRRAAQTHATLVLGSATPAVETYYWASQGHLTLLEMPHRIDHRPLPDVRLLDLRSPSGPPALFAPELEEALRQRLARKEQSILFLNRRGYATFVLCRDCGYVARCPHCSVSLTLHSAARRLQCHHCDYRRPVPTRCPKCNGDRVRHFGLGTEKVEAEAARLFPNARLLRMDRDTTGRKDAHRTLLRRFMDGDADILIGTQMVAKGLDFPRVTLVGVVAADTALNVPDFRAAERSYQLLAQVSGRAGRADLPGEVMVQTFSPHHYSLEAARTHDYHTFYNREIAERRELGYPPFSRLANLVVSDTVRESAEGRCRKLAQRVQEVAAAEGISLEILGPAPAPLERLQTRWRWHAVLKAKDLKSLNVVLRATLAPLDEEDRAGLVVDVDPMSLM